MQQSLRERYAGSALGLAWLVVGPVLLLGLYTVLYTLVFQVRPNGLDLPNYILYIFSGLVPFIAFSQALNSGTATLGTSRALLLNRMFPAELIPVREVVAAGTFLATGGAVIVGYKLLSGGATWLWLLVPPVVVLMAMGTIGLVWATSLINLVMKDMQQVLSYVTIMILIASPIAYTPDMVPPTLRVLLYVNPFAYYVMALQSLLVLGQLPPPSILFGCAAFGIVTFHTMYGVFAAGKRFIADQV